MMANAERGEVAVKAGAKDITLVLDFNALCALEDMASDAGLKVDFDKPSLRLMRMIMLVAMKRHQPETTAEDAGDALDAIGLQSSMDMLGKLLLRTMPDLANASPEAAKGKPGKAARAKG